MRAVMQTTGGRSRHAVPSRTLNRRSGARARQPAGRERRLFPALPVRHDDAAMDIVSYAAELLALPLDEFTAARNRKSRELKGAGHSDLAAELASLRKPGLPLWAVNRLSDTSAVLTRVRDAAARVLEAQSCVGSPAELLAASERYERELDSASEAVGAVLEREGHPAAPETLRRARDMVRNAALTGGETWDRLAAGALMSEPNPFDPFTAVAGATAAQRKAAGPAVTPVREVKAAQKRARNDAEEAERATRCARRLRDEATAAMAAAWRAEERAIEAEDEARRASEHAQQSQRALQEL